MDKYKKALKRFNKMQKWETNATKEEMLKYENEMLKVIENCRIEYERLRRG